MSRRGALALFAGAIFAAPALAAFPDRPVRVIVPFGPGGLADVTIRIVAETASGLLGQQIVVVNQPGAGGVTAARTVLSADADGHTLALFTNGTAISVSLVKSLGFDPLVDFVPVTALGVFDFVLVAGRQTPFRSLGEFIAAARASPGRLNIGTIGVGSTQNLSAALLKSLAGIDCQIVPFRTSPDVITAALRGDVQLAVEGYVAVRSLLDDGRLSALAVSGAARTPYLPAVPTVQEAGVAGFETTSWNAVFARAGTPAEVVAKLNTALRRALEDGEVRRKLLDLGIVARGGPAAEIADRLRQDIAKWGAVIERAAIAKQ